MKVTGLTDDVKCDIPVDVLGLLARLLPYCWPFHWKYGQLWSQGCYVCAFAWIATVA